MRHIALAVLLFSVGSFGALRLSLQGGASMSTPVLDFGGTIFTTTSETGFGGGLVFGVPLSQSVTWEFGGLYIPRAFKYTITGIEVKSTFPSVEIPIVFRWRVGRVLSFVAGGYVGMGMGKIKTEALGVTAESTYSEAGVETMDYGATGGLALEIPLGKTSDLFIEGRYVYGIKDLDTDADDKVNMRGIDAFLGLRFML